VVTKIYALGSYVEHKTNKEVQKEKPIYIYIYIYIYMSCYDGKSPFVTNK